MKPAAIQGDLADFRNVKSRKVIQLIVEIPMEAGQEMTRIFGWPNPASCVPVAIARLVEPKEGNEEVSEEPRSRPHGGGAKSYAQEAGRLCADKRFQEFFKPQALRALNCDPAAWDEESAQAITSDFVRWFCDVSTRRDIIGGTFAAQQFNKLVAEYEAEKVMA